MGLWDWEAGRAHQSLRALVVNPNAFVPVSGSPGNCEPALGRSAASPRPQRAAETEAVGAFLTLLAGDVLRTGTVRDPGLTPTTSSPVRHARPLAGNRGLGNDT